MCRITRSRSKSRARTGISSRTRSQTGIASRTRSQSRSRKADGAKKTKKLASGVPPWHAIAFIVATFNVCFLKFPSLEALDEVATIETFTKRSFPSLLSVQALAFTRLFIALTIWLTTFYMVFIMQGWTIYTNYKPKSQLNNSYIYLSGLRTLFQFTSWSWIFLGFSYSLCGYIALQVSLGNESDIDPWMLRAALALYEIASPFALLVSSVVRYAIWPVAEKGGKPHTLTSFRNQMMHNMNSVYALTEMSLLGGIPMSISHAPIPCVVGLVYILFSWCSCHIFGKHGSGAGPQYQYFFMDTTLGYTTTISLVVLLAVMLTSFSIFVAIKVFVDHMGGTIPVNSMCVILISSLVCRIK